MEYDPKIVTYSRPAFKKSVNYETFDISKVKIDSVQTHKGKGSGKFCMINYEYDSASKNEPFIIKCDKIVLDYGISCPKPELLSKFPELKHNIPINLDENPKLKDIFDSLAEKLITETVIGGVFGHDDKVINKIKKAETISDKIGAFKMTPPYNVYTSKKGAKADQELTTKFLDLVQFKNKIEGSDKETISIATAFAKITEKGKLEYIHGKDLIGKRIVLEPFIHVYRVWCGGTGVSLQSALVYGLIESVTDRAVEIPDFIKEKLLTISPKPDLLSDDVKVDSDDEKEIIPDQIQKAVEEMVKKPGPKRVK